MCTSSFCRCKLASWPGAQLAQLMAVEFASQPLYFYEAKNVSFSILVVCSCLMASIFMLMPREHAQRCEAH